MGAQLGVSVLQVGIDGVTGAVAGDITDAGAPDVVYGG